MVYLDNTNNPQEVWIPRNDGNGSTHHAHTYQEGYEDGVEHQKSLLSSVTFTENGEFERSDGWSAVTVDVDVTPNLEEVSVVISADTTTVTPSSGYDGMSAVTVDASEYGQTNYDNGFDDGFDDGYASGSTEEREKLSAVTFTANTAVTMDEGGYSAITVNVPTGQTYNIEQNKPFTATSNGSYTITPTSASTTVTDRFDSDTDRYYITATASGYPSTGHFELFYIEDEFDSSKGQIYVYIENGYLDYDDSDWYGGEIVDLSLSTNIDLFIRNANRDFGWSSFEDFYYHYDAMSAVTLNVNVPQTGTSATLGEGSFSANGTYSASTDNLDGYSAITINVPTGMTSKDIIMCVSGGCWFNTNYEIEYGDSFDLEHCTFGVAGVYGQHVTLIAGNDYDTLRLNHSSNDVYFRYFYNTINYNIPLPSSGSAFEDNHIIFNSTGITIDGNVVYSYTTNPYSGKGKLIVFADTTNGGNLARGQIAKIGRIKVYGSNGALKATFEPRLDENNFPYFKYIEENIDIYASGDTAPFYEEIIVDSSYQSGFTDGMAHQKSLLGEFTATTNGSFSAENGYSAITVNVPQQAGVYGSKTINVNGTYSASTDSLDGFSSVTVNVPQSGVQIPIFFADYIHTDTLSSNTYQDYIDTGLFPTDDVVFRVKGYRKGEQQGTRIVGWCPEETNHSDSQDFRLFWAGGRTVYFDWGNGRIDYTNYFDSLSGYTDITCGNYYAYDNVEEQIIVSGSQKSVSELYSAGTIRADVGSWWLKSLEIYDGNTLLFDGVAAYDGSGNVGLYDKVSHTLKTAVTAKQMVYEFDSGSTLPLSSITFTANTSVTVSDKAYTAITVNVSTASTYNDGYNDGYDDAFDEVEANAQTLSVSANGTYNTDLRTEGYLWNEVIVNVPQTGGSATLGTKVITDNGRYSASTDNLDGYSEVRVNVSGNEQLRYFIEGKSYYNFSFPTGTTYIRKNCFRGYDGLEGVTFRSSITGIGEYAFADCVNLLEVVKSNSHTIEHIPSHCFYNCYNLGLTFSANTNFFNNVVTIGDYAFYNCSSEYFTAVTACCLTDIGDYAFANCSHLRRLVLGDTLETIGVGAFSGCDLYEIYMLSPTPPTYDSATTFNGVRSNGYFYYPQGSDYSSYHRGDLLGWNFIPYTQ